MFQSFSGISIEHISSCVPERKVLNKDFQSLLSEKEIRKFERTVGIQERRWVSDSTTASDLGFQAAWDIFNSDDFEKDQVDVLIFLSQTSDYKIPFTSNILQSRLGLKKETLCLDINAGCAGFVQGLSTAYSLARSLPRGHKVLFIIGETLSKILSKNDRSTSMLFGDAASAIIISNTGKQEDTSYFNFFSDGANSDAIMIPDGGYRNQVSNSSFEVKIDENNMKTDLNLSMDGSRVLDFTLREICPSILNLLDHFHLDKTKIDKFLFHQSNKFIIKQLASQLNASMDNVLINIQSFGNTSGVSIPLLVSSNFDNFEQSKMVLCSGYGSGLSWGNCIIDLSKTLIKPVINYKK